MQDADCQGRPPLQIHPWARHPGRPFHPALEWTLFDMERVDSYLASHVCSRKVIAAGKVSVAEHFCYLARTHLLEEAASVRFIPERETFQFQAGDGALVAEFSAGGLDTADLIGHIRIEEALSKLFQVPLPLEGV